MEMARFDDGTPCWFELRTNEPDLAASFYANVLGWRITAGGSETSGYTMCQLGEDPVAGIVNHVAEILPSRWTVSLRTSSIIDALGDIERAGGSTIEGPDSVLELGHRAIVADPTGAIFGLWEPQNFEGARRVGEPGAYLWSELTTSDLPRSDSFYAAVFGLVATKESAGSSDARQFAKGGHPIVGMVAHDTGDEARDEWTITFMVTDLEDTLVRAVAGGGSLVSAVVDLPVGRHGLVTDATGATFGLLEPRH